MSFCLYGTRRYFFNFDAHQFKTCKGIWQDFRYPPEQSLLEQALKIPIRLRKNSLVHRTCHGAKVAGILMSIIQTCRLRKVNPIDYLTILQANKSAVFKNPDDWLPWRYEETLKRQAVSPLAA